MTCRSVTKVQRATEYLSSSTQPCTAGGIVNDTLLPKLEELPKSLEDSVNVAQTMVVRPGIGLHGVVLHWLCPRSDAAHDRPRRRRRAFARLRPAESRPCPSRHQLGTNF